VGIQQIFIFLKPNRNTPVLQSRHRGGTDQRECGGSEPETGFGSFWFPDESHLDTRTTPTGCEIHRVEL